MTDPRFPNRPDDSPDFWLLAETVQDFDSASDDNVSFERLVGPVVDPRALAYMSEQRALRAYTMLKSGGQMRLQAAWLDGFMLGALYQKRKAERATDVEVRPGDDG